MNQEEPVRLFNQRLDRLLADKMPDTFLSDLDEQALELAQRLSQINLSEESRNRDALYIRLVKLSSTNNTKTASHWFPSQRIFAFQVQFVTWIRATLVLMYLLFFALGIPKPSSIISTSKPLVTYYSTMATVDTAPPTQSYQFQALQPAPIPTPLAKSTSSAIPGDTPHTQNTGLKPLFKKPGMAQTPKPIPISLPCKER